MFTETLPAVFLPGGLLIFAAAFPAAVWASPASTAPAEGPFVTLAAVGDIRLDGPIESLARVHGASAPVAGVRRWLDADIVLGNLECAVTTRGTPAGKKWVFRAPPENLKFIREAGVTLLSLANNHVMDYGPVGLEDTISALNAQGFDHAGAGPDAATARRPVFLRKNGLTIGFLAFTSTIPEENWAGEKRPGVAYSDLGRLAGWVRDAKARCDVLVVSFHGGTELSPVPNAVQRGFAKLAAEAGADLVIGHHPHVVQPAEWRGESLIVYSVGNFLFVSPTPGTEKSVIARFTLGKGSVRAEFVPIDTNWGRLRRADEAQRREIHAALDSLGAFAAKPGRLALLPP